MRSTLRALALAAAAVALSGCVVVPAYRPYPYYRPYHYYYYP